MTNYLIEIIEPDEELVSEANAILNMNFDINNRQEYGHKLNECLKKFLNKKEISFKKTIDKIANKTLIDTVPIYTFFNYEIEVTIMKLFDKLIELYKSYDKI